MSAVDTTHETFLKGLDDVPPPPQSYSKYVERTLSDRAQAAYERGFEHGAKHRFIVLLIGLVVGWLAAVGYTNMQ